jgi:GrpB-like predicted nucleotidyltransferase (UPF0157 family)
VLRGYRHDPSTTLLIAVDAENEPIGVVGYTCAFYQAKGFTAASLGEKYSGVERFAVRHERPQDIGDIPTEENSGMRVDVVVPYHPGWPAAFDALQARIARVLDGVDHTIEHVGSTAVPGLSAKPVIDIDVVSDGSLIAAALAALAAAGYRHQGDLGIVGREAFHAPPGSPYHHLYLVVAGSVAHRDHIDFRDFLRNHPDDARRYGQLKVECSCYLATDRDATSTANGRSSKTSCIVRGDHTNEVVRRDAR